MSKCKQISQETFDAAVKENIDDFGLSPEEAIQDTIKEFRLQGIDLSNIVTSAATGEEHQIVASAKRLSRAIGNPEDSEKELKYLVGAIPENPEGKVMGINNSVIESCGGILELSDKNPELVVLVFQLLHTVLFKTTQGRDKLLLKNSNKASPLKLIIDTLLTHPDSAKIQASGFRAIKTASTKSEAVKGAFVEQGGLPAATAAIRLHLNDSGVIRQVAGTLHAITNADDYTITLSKVFDTAKELAAGGVLPLLYQAMRAHAGSPETLADLFAALKGCAVQNDIVKGIMADGGLSLALDALRAHLAHPGCTGRCMLLLANLAENDDAKKELCQGPALPLLLAAMEAHARDPRALRAGCAALGSLALRMPDNCDALMAAGAGRLLLDAMRAHPQHGELCRVAAIAVRNVAARCPEHRPALLEDGAEALVRRARDTHACCADAAFDCLRDLGCEYGGLGDRAGRGEHSAYADCDDSLLRSSQLAAGSAMVTWEEDDG